MYQHEATDLTLFDNLKEAFSEGPSAFGLASRCAPLAVRLPWGR
jgi:hypothetical protein